MSQWLMFYRRDPDHEWELMPGARAGRVALESVFVHEADDDARPGDVVAQQLREHAHSPGEYRMIAWDDMEPVPRQAVVVVERPPTPEPLIDGRPLSSYIPYPRQEPGR